MTVDAKPDGSNEQACKVATATIPAGTRCNKPNMDEESRREELSRLTTTKSDNHPLGNKIL